MTETNGRRTPVQAGGANLPGSTADVASSRSYGRDSLEFARLVNLSDAVFAIAMTLLVFTLEIPDVPPSELATALADAVPRLMAVLLSFALIANIWWQHHKLVARLDRVEPGFVAIDLLLLGAVALVPYPTGLLGSAPDARAAVLPFIGVFIVLSLLYLGLMMRAERTRAWCEPIPPGLLPWVTGGLVLVVVCMTVALLVALWSPLGGLFLLAISSFPERLLARRSPPGYRAWA